MADAFRLARPETTTLGGFAQLANLAPLLILRVFGPPPDRGDGYKVTGIYSFEDGAGARFCLYDWKETSAWHREDPELPPVFWTRDWGTILVGGGPPHEADRFLDWVELRLLEHIEAHWDEPLPAGTGSPTHLHWPMGIATKSPACLAIWERLLARLIGEAEACLARGEAARAMSHFNNAEWQVWHAAGWSPEAPSWLRIQDGKRRAARQEALARGNVWRAVFPRFETRKRPPDRAGWLRAFP